MNSAAKIFCDHLDQRNIKYLPPLIDNKTVTIPWEGEKCPSTLIFFQFSDDGTNVHIRTGDIQEIEKEHTSQIVAAYITCNDLNKQYRWFTFYVNNDDESVAKVEARGDAIMTPYTIGSDCWELLGRMTSILDDAYPTIMEARITQAFRDIGGLNS